MSGRRQRRQVVVVLRPEEWDRLERMARDAERDPYQQARWLVLRGLDAPDEPAPEERSTSEVA